MARKGGWGKRALDTEEKGGREEKGIRWKGGEEGIRQQKRGEGRRGN